MSALRLLGVFLLFALTGPAWAQNPQCGFTPAPGTSNQLCASTAFVHQETNNIWVVSGNNIHNGNTGNVGIGVSSPTNLFNVEQTITNSANDSPNGLVFVQKTPNYTGFPTANYLPALMAITLVQPNVVTNQVGVIGEAANQNTSGSTGSAIGVAGLSVCQVVSCTVGWGGLFTMYDNSGQSSVPNNLTGVEIDNFGHNQNNGTTTTALAIISGTPDGIGTHITGQGIVFGGSGCCTFGTLVKAALTAVNGVDFSGSTFSGNAILSPSFSVGNAGLVTSNAIGNGFLESSSNTGGSNSVVIANNGTSSNTNTVSTIQETLACANCSFQIEAQGGANPNAIVVSGAGFTSGLTINSQAGPLQLEATGVSQFVQLPGSTSCSALKTDGSGNISCSATGVSCGPASPTASFTTVNGIVTHC
jgi:hypothetical protein